MKNYLWKGFLALYLVVLLVHVFESGLSWGIAPFLALGFVVALISHRTSHVISLLFLVAHMTIEAIEYAAHGSAFTTGILIWVMIHVAMDGVFLWGEVKRHFYSVRFPMWSTIALGIICIYFFVPHQVTGVISQAPSMMEFIVIGGVMGCVLSHLVPHKHEHA